MKVEADVGSDEENNVRKQYEKGAQCGGVQIDSGDVERLVREVDNAPAGLFT